MATLNQTKDDFAISLAADQLLDEVSGDFADSILKSAVTIAGIEADGDRVVTTNEIKQVVQEICDVLERGSETTKNRVPIRIYVQELRDFCNRIQSER